MKYPYTVVDAHCDTIDRLVHTGEELCSNSCHLSLDDMQRYDGYIQFFAAWIDEKQENWLSRAMEFFDKFYIELEKKRDDVQLITDCETLHRALDEKKVGALLTVEDARAICGSLSNLRMLYRLGVRAMTLTWNHDNDVADGTLSTRGVGLTHFGREVVREMNRIGMMVDVSHISRKGFWDVLEVSSKPVFASHSNADAICHHPRNLDDEQIRALIKSGGMIGINIYPKFLSEGETAGIDDILHHIEHILSLGGESVLGIGTDFDGIDSTPEGLSNAGDLYRLFDKMKEMGCSDSLIADITHGNFVKFLDKMLKNEKK